MYNLSYEEFIVAIKDDNKLMNEILQFNINLEIEYIECKKKYENEMITKEMIRDHFIKLIKDITEELMYREFRRYELDWE